MQISTYQHATINKSNRVKTHNNQRRGDQKVIMGNCGKMQCSESLFFITQINTGTAEERLICYLRYCCQLYFFQSSSATLKLIIYFFMQINLYRRGSKLYTVIFAFYRVRHSDFNWHLTHTSMYFFTFVHFYIILYFVTKPNETVS